MPKPDNPKQTKTKAQAMLIDIKIPKKHTFHWFMAADKKMQANKNKNAKALRVHSVILLQPSRQKTVI